LCIIHHMSFAFDIGLKDSIGLCYMFMVYLVNFCSLFIRREFFSGVDMGTVLLKFGSCMIFSILPKEWPFSKRFTNFKVVLLFLKEKLCPLNLFEKPLPVCPNYVSPQSGHVNLWTLLERHLSLLLQTTNFSKNAYAYAIFLTFK